MKMSIFRSMLLSTVLMPTALLASPLALANTVFVTNNQDHGQGSLRSAIQAANQNPSITRIQFQKNVGTVLVEQGLQFSGQQAIAINGRGSIIKAQSNTRFDLLSIQQSSDITLSQLTLEGSGGNGLLVLVPSDSKATVSVDIHSVTVAHNGLHGIFIDDQDDVDKAAGSPASIHLSLTRSTILGNGVAASDFDGVRIDEGGVGDITVQMIQVVVQANGGDGVEFDEQGVGDVKLNVIGSEFIDNGFQDANDLEDGIDIDEAGEGSVISTIIATEVRGSRDEGIDFDEQGVGDIDVHLTQVTVTQSLDEGIKFDEADQGNLQVRAIDIDVLDNNDDGAQWEETGYGDLDVKVIASSLRRNDKFGIKVKQSSEGQGQLILINNDLVANVDGPFDSDGVAVTVK